MDNNSPFQNFANQNAMNSYGNGNPNFYRYGDMNVNQPQQGYGGGFVNRSPMSSPPTIPVRVIFSPEQIAPQEIPTNGTPALFPLSDGSKIIAKSLLGNGMFDERVYVLQPNIQMENGQSKMSEFEQVMAAIGKVEDNLNKVLNDLYGPKTKQEGDTNNE